MSESFFLMLNKGETANLIGINLHLLALHKLLLGGSLPHHVTFVMDINMHLSAEITECLLLCEAFRCRANSCHLTSLCTDTITHGHRALRCDGASHACCPPP